jgi:hypothetical protein
MPVRTRFALAGVVAALSLAVAGAPAAGAAPATLSLQVGPPPTFDAFTPGVTSTYEASTTASVNSTAGSALLSVYDPSSFATGHLVNGSSFLPQPLQARARNAIHTGTAFNNVGSASSPLNLIQYEGPASDDPVSLQFRQQIASNHVLQTGTYAKELTFTLSTTTPCTMSTTVTLNVNGPARAPSSGTVSCPVDVKEQLAQLIAKVINATNMRPAVKALLIAKLQSLVAGFDPANPQQRRGVCLALKVFTTAVPVLAPAQAAEWTADANRIRAALGC